MIGRTLGHYEITELLGALGETDDAMAVLERAEGEHQPFMGLAAYPGLDLLRREPRFQDLMRRIGLA